MFVTGAGSSSNISGTLEVGILGTGAMNIQSGGLVTSANADIGYRSSASDSGAVTVSGIGSTWNNSANLSIGGSAFGAGPGTGTMTVSNGGRVTTATAQIGLQSGAVGTATVTGSGSTWAASSDIVVGQSGSGTMEISSGGKVSSLRGYLGFFGGSSGSVIVHDTSSSWIASGSFFLGNGGSGSLQVLNGALASTAGNSYLGFNAGASGTGLVSGLGSTWNTNATICIGGNLAAAGGQGSLRIENRGSVIAAGTLLYNTGLLELSGVTTYSGPITSYGGQVRTFSDAGLANNITLGAGGINIDNQTAGGVSTFSGGISGAGGLTTTGVSSDATVRLTGNNSYSGATTIASGILAVDGSITSATTVYDGATLAGTGTVGPITINGGGTISPGHSPGLLTTGNAYLAGGSNYTLDLRTDGAGAAGADWDSLGVSGALDISGLSADSPLNVRLRTFDSLDNPNPLDDWNPTVSHTWPSVVTTSAGLVGDFDASLFHIDTTGFQSPIGGTFSVVQDGTNLDLQYDAAVVDASVLVTNFAEPFRSATPISNPQYWGAQSFLPDSQRYALTSVEAVVGNDSGSSGIVIELRQADANGDIDLTSEGLLTTFTAPDLTGDPVARLFAPDAAVTLEPGTKYWFILGNFDTGSFDWSYADTANTLGPGSLSNYADSSDGGATWDYRDTEFPYFIQVKAVVSMLGGDYNGDGMVNAADYTVWRDTLGATGTGLAADGDGSGTIDQGDYDIWKDNFGAIIGGGSGSASAPLASVPEPATLPMLVSFLFSTLLWRWK